MILCIETATNLCSVALCSEKGVLSLLESSDTKSHASLLTVYIKEILEKAGIKPSDLDAISVSKGPGSYTGLRIGVSAAKGIAFAASVPLIGIETTFSMFRGLTEGIKDTECNTLYCPMLDARRMEVYYAIYDSRGNPVKDISAEVIDTDSFAGIQQQYELVFFGDGASKLRDVIRRPNIRFEENFRMSASHLCAPSYEAFNEKRFEDVAYFEPLYLKDFITTKQKKNILGI